MTFQYAYAAFLVLLCLTVILLLQKEKGSSGRFRIAVIFTFLMLFVLILPFREQGISESWFVKGALSLYRSAQVFLLNREFEAFDWPAEWNGSVFGSLYRFTLAVLFVAAPCLMAGSLLMILRPIRSEFLRVKRKKRKGECYLFSEPSEKALLLAEELKENGMCVFCSAREREIYDEIIERGFIPQEKKPDELGRWFFSRQKKLVMLFMSDSDEQNLQAALRFMERRKTTRKMNKLPLIPAYVFTSRPEADLLLNARGNDVETARMLCKRIQEGRAVVYRELQVHSALFADPEKKDLHVLLVGCGTIGTEIMKALLWLAAFPGRTLRISVLDREDKKEQFFRVCPGMKEEMVFPYGTKPVTSSNASKIGGKNAGDPVKPEEPYRIRICFLPCADISLLRVELLNDVSLVYIATGRDDRNVDHAIRLRRDFSRLRLKSGIVPDSCAEVPEIRVAIRDKLHKLDFSDRKNNSYNLARLGVKEDCLPFRGDHVFDDQMINYELEKHSLIVQFNYSLASVINFYSKAEKEAKEKARKNAIEIIKDYRALQNKRTVEEWYSFLRDWSKWKTDIPIKFYKHGYDGCSSRARALFDETHPLIGQQLKQNTYRQTEHIRWWIYMLTEGYAPYSFGTDVAGVHHLMVPWDELSDDDRKKDNTIEENIHYAEKTMGIRGEDSVSGEEAGKGKVYRFFKRFLCDWKRDTGTTRKAG